MSVQFTERFDTLRTALQSFDFEVGKQAVAFNETPIALVTPPPAMDNSIRRRIAKILNTKSHGIPDHYENAWHWAGVWVAEHGVTLPPDTNEYRSLRNWFCFQVDSFKKNRVSAKSRQLLAKYNIDLSLYRAPNTGRGELLDDQAMIDALLLHFEITGSYDLPSEADPMLLEWQRRLLDGYRSRGTSTRMRAIESQMPGFCFGLWMRPDETPILKGQLSWWRSAQEFRALTVNFPAFRGVIDKRTPAHLLAWASDQISSAVAGKLSSRQRGEMISLGLLATQEHIRTKSREEALLQARQSAGQMIKYGYRERDLKSFLGVALLIRLLCRNAPLVDIYSTLAIKPHQFTRIQTGLKLMMVPLLGAGSNESLSHLRELYREFPEEFDGARDAHDLSLTMFC